jgi:hypothetical protein
MKKINRYEIEFNYAHLSALMHEFRVRNGLSKVDCDELFELSAGVWGVYERGDNLKHGWDISVGTLTKIINAIFEDDFTAERLVEFWALRGVK